MSALQLQMISLIVRSRFMRQTYISKLPNLFNG